MLTQTQATLLALWLTSHSSVVASQSSSVQKSHELVGDWVGRKISISLLAEGTGSLKYQPPDSARLIRESRWVFPITRWSLSGKKVKLKIGQHPDARYHDGSGYTLNFKARFESPLLIIELWDKAHFRRIALQREGEQDRLVKEPSLDAEAEETTTGREIPKAGIDGVTNPRLIKKTMVTPKLPRKLKGSGQVILSVLIEADGTVSEISVIRCNRPGLGIEESAIAAVREWRYEPAEKDGEPVAVYFTVVVELAYHGRTPVHRRANSWSLSAQADPSSTPRPTTVEQLLLLLEEEHELRFRDCSTSRLRIRLCSQNKVDTVDVNATLRSAFSSSAPWEETKKRSRLKTVLGPRSVTVAIHNAKQRVLIELAPPLPDCVVGHGVPHVDVFKDEPSFTQPKVVHSTHAEMPSRAILEVKNPRIAGVATISTEGRVVDTCLIKVSAEGYGFETEFFESLRHWRFEPATVNGEPIAVRFTVLTEWFVEMR